MSLSTKRKPIGLSQPNSNGTYRSSTSSMGDRKYSLAYQTLATFDSPDASYSLKHAYSQQHGVHEIQNSPSMASFAPQSGGLRRSGSITSMSSVATTRSQRFADVTRGVFRKFGSSNNDKLSNTAIVQNEQSSNVLSGLSKVLRRKGNNYGTLPKTSHSSQYSEDSLYDSPSVPFVPRGNNYIPSDEHNHQKNTIPTYANNSDYDELRDKYEIVKLERDAWIKRYGKQLGISKLGVSNDDPILDLGAKISEYKNKNEQLETLLVTLGADLPGQVVHDECEIPSTAPAADPRDLEAAKARANTRTYNQSERIRTKIQSFNDIVEQEKESMQKLRQEFHNLLGLVMNEKNSKVENIKVDEKEEKSVVENHLAKNANKTENIVVESIIDAADNVKNVNKIIGNVNEEFVDNSQVSFENIKCSASKKEKTTEINANTVPEIVKEVIDNHVGDELQQVKEDNESSKLSKESEWEIKPTLTSNISRDFALSLDQAFDADVSDSLTDILNMPFFKS